MLYGLFFAPTRTLGGFIQHFAALREPLLLLASHQQTFGEQGSKNMFVHVFSCECVCLCVKIKVEREGVGYHTETSLL